MLHVNSCTLVVNVQSSFLEFESTAVFCDVHYHLFVLQKQLKETQKTLQQREKDLQQLRDDVESHRSLEKKKFVSVSVQTH